ncbi:hypothetical protein L1987_35373 [Smallanthus sonchifolius]|uniref:Uncharacterized protein n=1 Tax=Smallanthus sonchifolius TaxID=185202 RepID=A0ACB9HXV2_9ASTR|nr:hypothetical protein L1987_35373 [Smallanthus sonchifolius]
MGASLVFMIVYVWSRELPNTRVNIQGLVELKGFYLPWAMLAIDLVLGNRLMLSLLGIGVGHFDKLVKHWGRGFQMNSPVKQDPSTGVAFQGRGYRLGGTSSASTRIPPNVGAFSGTSRRLHGR